MNVILLQRVLVSLLLTLSLGLLLVAPPQTSAAPPEETRPHLELPFPGDATYRVTCGYDCYQHHNSMRHAVDFAVPMGDPISAAASGEVMAVTWELGLPRDLDLGDALIVYIDHGEGWFTRYVHLDGITVQVGDRVEQGDIIGYSGTTGASAPHLHFELKHGNSLHSNSVPVDDLFDGEAPVADRYYQSNNRRLGEARPVPTPTISPKPTISTAAEPASAVTPTPAVNDAAETFFPQVETGLSVTHGAVRVNEPVTVTFTLHNSTEERLELSMLGVGARLPDETLPLDGVLYFDRFISLNPGRSYTFEREILFEEAGEFELFVFALSPHNEMLPLGGDAQTANVRVEPPSETSFYIPLITADSATPAPAGEQDPSQPSPTPEEPAETR